MYIVYVVCGKSVVYPILINQKNSTLNHCSNSEKKVCLT